MEGRPQGRRRRRYRRVLHARGAPRNQPEKGESMLPDPSQGLVRAVRACVDVHERLGAGPRDDARADVEIDGPLECAGQEACQMRIGARIVGYLA